MNFINNSSSRQVLMLAGRIPAPDAKGDQLVAYHRILHYINSNKNVDLVTFWNRKSIKDTQLINNLEHLGVNVYPINYSFWKVVIFAPFVLLNTRIPIQAALYFSFNYRRKLNELMLKKNYYVVHCVLIRVAINIPEGHLGSTVLDMIDSMVLNFSNKIKNYHWIIKIPFQFEILRLGKWENYLINKTKISIVVSNIDRSVYSQVNKIYVIKNGVDLKKFPERKKHYAKKIVFFGNLNYRPNIEAVFWFLEKCWDNILKTIPDASFFIIGSNPSDAFIKKSKSFKSVFVTGRVESISDAIEDAALSVAPMRSGSGMQNKILESMASGIPVVTTRLGKGDISAKEGIEIFSEDDPSLFSSKVCLLLSDNDLNKAVGLAGKSFIMREHQWEENSKIIDQYIDTHFLFSANPDNSHELW